MLREPAGLRDVRIPSLALLAAVMASVLAACGDGAVPSAPVASARAAPAMVAVVDAAPAASGLELFVFDCGRIRLPTVTDFGLSDDQTDVRVLFVPCYLIRHPRGDLLWDAGLPPRYATGQWIDDETGAGHLLDATVASQLDVLGMDAADVEQVAFSHFHYDHVGDANAFAGAELLIQRSEHEVAFGPTPDVAFFVPELYSALATTPTRLLDGDHDVFGDGSVRILSAPGHTPGHQVLLLDLADTGKVLLSGDLWHFEVSRELRAVPGFNTDPTQTLASMAHIEALMAREGAELWLEHSLAFHERLQMAPFAYR